jgi:hypothetical protein
VNRNDKSLNAPLRSGKKTPRHARLPGCPAGGPSSLERRREGYVCGDRDKPVRRSEPQALAPSGQVGGGRSSVPITVGRRSRLLTPDSAARQDGSGRSAIERRCGWSSTIRQLTMADETPRRGELYRDTFQFDEAFVIDDTTISPQFRMSGVEAIEINGQGGDDFFASLISPARASCRSRCTAVPTRTSSQAPRLCRRAGWTAPAASNGGGRSCVRTTSGRCCSRSAWLWKLLDSY